MECITLWWTIIEIISMPMMMIMIEARDYDHNYTYIQILNNDNYMIIYW